MHTIPCVTILDRTNESYTTRRIVCIPSDIGDGRVLCEASFEYKVLVVVRSTGPPRGAAGTTLLVTLAEKAQSVANLDESSSLASAG